MFAGLVNFANEPELKMVPSGENETSVMNALVAIRQGKDRASFINVTAWGGLAEYIGNNYRKGDEIYIEGDIRNSNYTVGDRVIQTNYVRIYNARHTFGQKSRRLAVAEETNEPDAPDDSE